MEEEEDEEKEKKYIKKMNKLLEISTLNIILMIAASIITSLALSINDTTNIVGAMVISALLDPLYVIMQSILNKNWKILGKAIITEFFYLVISFVISMIISIILTIFTRTDCKTDEVLLCWQTPMMFRLGSWAYLIVGFLYSMVCGVVLALAFDIIIIKVGVAIAIALVPPICNAGMMLIYGVFGNLININGGFPTSEDQKEAFRTMGASLIILFINISTFVFSGFLTLYIDKKIKERKKIKVIEF
jgi:uncharacterized membrane protein